LWFGQLATGLLISEMWRVCWCCVVFIGTFGMFESCSTSMTCQKGVLSSPGTACQIKFLQSISQFDGIWYLQHLALMSKELDWYLFSTRRLRVQTEKKLADILKLFWIDGLRRMFHVLIV
jgi:hypothetical protein